MSQYRKVLEELKEKKARKEKGLYNGVPFPYERYKEYVHSIDKGMYYGLLGASGSGKSRWIRDTFIYHPVKFSMQNDYPIKILYFALEDGVHLVYRKIISHYLYERHGIRLPMKHMESKEKPLEAQYLTIMENDQEFYDKFEDTVFIVNNATTPNEIKYVCDEFYQKYGADYHIEVIIDNYANVTRDEQDASEWAAVKRLSRNVIRLDLCKRKNMTVVAVLQMDLESEKNTMRNSGKAAIAALEPNMGAIGDAKVVCRDMFTVFGLFSPWRYEIPRYPNNDEERSYNVEVLRNKFRALNMLKNNEGDMAPRVGLLFDGAVEKFEELPLVTDKDKLTQLYETVIQEEREKKERFFNNKLFS